MPLCGLSQPAIGRGRVQQRLNERNSIAPAQFDHFMIPDDPHCRFDSTLDDEIRQRPPLQIRGFLAQRFRFTADTRLQARSAPFDLWLGLDWHSGLYPIVRQFAG
jgi:hypothetical protein